MTDRPGWFDAHCHLQDRYRADDAAVDDALAEAEAAGVTAMVVVGTDADSSAEALALAARERAGSPALWATVGLHPHEASAGVDAVAALLGSLDADARRRLVAVGECGLDYHYDHSPRPAQRDAFAAQVALAADHDLTLVVHTRAAWDDTLDVLRAAGPPTRTIIHCFTGGPVEARRCLELGAWLSFSGIVTFKNAPEVREAAALCPADRLLVETDAPFLAPVPHRGRPNRPAWVAVVGEAVAAVRGEDPAGLAETTRRATRAAYGLP